MTELKKLFTKTDNFLIGSEIVPSRGIAIPDTQDKVIDFLEDLCRDERVNWISVTDNAGGNPKLSPSFLGERIIKNGKSTIIHLTCKDYNRNGLESLAWMYASKGLNNLLVMSGDYPITGHRGVSQPVFDTDAVGLLRLLTDMNSGLRSSGKKPGTIIELEPTDFFLGSTVSPFKLSEAEQMMQYQKLKLKVRTGAQFVIPQVGYDIRKFHELLIYMKENHLDLPLIGNIYKLNAGVARIFNKGLIPGCVVSDELLERVEKEKKSPDKGKAFFTDFAAMQLATFKGMGYRAGYICGVEKHKDFNAILEKATEYENTDWQELIPKLLYPNKNEFYYYGQDSSTGLSDKSQKNPVLGKILKKYYRKHVTPNYRFSRIIHPLFFEKSGMFYKTGVRVFRFLEKHERFKRLSYYIERMIKEAIFNCRECGDCSLADITYLCPQSQCAKNQRNGPCGGSRNDMCEVNTYRTCIWVRAYCRQRYFGSSTEILNRKPVIKDNALIDTSSWGNYFLSRDHSSKPD